MARKILKKYLVLIPVFLYIGIYGLVSGSFLGRFPFVRSDEAWLAGLTRDMMNAGSFGVTESFFDLKPRVPHAIKLLYHWLQMGYLSVFGYRVEAVRLLSLTAALLCLFLIFLIGRRLGGGWFGLLLTVAVSLDIQFIYASHFARQEILICASLMACLLILLGCSGRPSPRTAILLAVITGISIGFHPNSFLCAAMCGSVMAVPIVKARGRGLASLLIYIGVTGVFAVVFVGISYGFDPHFLTDYLRYGEEEFELSGTASGRLAEFFAFFQSIFQRESGTYYLPELRLEMIGMALAGGLLIPVRMILRNGQTGEEQVWCSHTDLLIAAVLGLCTGMLVIGRYNQTSIVFFLLPGWLLVGQLLLLFERKGRILIFSLLFAAMIYGNGGQIGIQLGAPSCDSYLEQIAALVPEDAKVIGNLNMDFYFDQGKLLDYRNLPYLEGPEALKNYVKEQHIRYIFYTDELDYLYDHRPYYNAIYGNAMFTRDLKNFCLECCEPVGSFENPVYAARVISLIRDQSCNRVTVYKVCCYDSPPR